MEKKQRACRAVDLFVCYLEAPVAADNKSRKGTSHDSKNNNSARSVRAWSIGGQVFIAETRREALKMRAEELGLG